MKGVTESDLASTRNDKNYVLRAVVTPVAATGNTESDAGIVTCAARPVLFHIHHGISATSLASGENTAMAVDAYIHLFCLVSMDFMAKKSRFPLEHHIRGSFMAPVAVTSYRKSLFPVVTAATRTARLHFDHQVSFAARTGNKVLVVTVAALVTETEMEIMTEDRIGIKIYIFDSVTFRAVTLDTESSLPVMAPAA